MIAILLGLFAALCWSVHDLVARKFAEAVGPYRMALMVMLVGAAVLALPVFLNGRVLTGNSHAYQTAALMGVSYAIGVGALFKAFSLAPVSVVGPFTAGYPALVVVWGVVNGLSPSASEWLAIAVIIAGAVVVARSGDTDGGVNAIAQGQFPVVVAASALACLGLAGAVTLGQAAAITLGEIETTFLSRFSAALILVPMAFRDHTSNAVVSRNGWLGIIAMAVLDVLAVSGINYAGQFDNKEFAAMGISAYGALAVLLGMLFLKEKVSAGQWLGIAMIVAGVGVLGWPKG